MNARTYNILKFIFGVTGAAVCVVASILTSIYAGAVAYIIDPIFIGIAIQCLGLAASSLGFKIGAAAAIEKKEEKNQIPTKVHLYHHYPKSSKKDNDSKKREPLAKKNDKKQNKFKFFTSQKTAPARSVLKNYTYKT